MKKPDYKEAVDQIELAAKGNDPAPIIPADDSIKQTSHEGEDETIERMEDISQTDDYDPEEESQLQIAETIPKSTPIPNKKKPVNKPKAVSTPITQLKLESETKENDEKVSRSGRKIKEKKMNNDEMDPDEVFTQPRKRLKIENENRSNQKPAQELNDSAINDFCISKMHILQDPVRKQFLTTQFDMIKTVQEIKQALGLDEVDVDRALESCKTLKEKVVPSITQFMLLKYSNTVVTIKRLRNYIGNVESWNLEEKQLIEFQEKAKEIRDIASDIYFSLKVNIFYFLE